MPSSETRRYFTRSSVTPENNSNDNSSECSSKSKQMDMSCPRPTRRKPPSCSSSSSSIAIPVPCPCKLDKYIRFFKVVIVICLFISIVYFISDHNANFFLRELHKLRGHISNVEEIVQKVSVKKCDVDKQLQEIAKSIPDLKGIAVDLKDDIKKCGKSTAGISRWFQGPDILRRAVKAEIEIYDADKTNKVDFALESSGGMILSTRNTESFNSGPSLSIFGIPLCASSNKPSALIQPGVMPGECWAFRGNTGISVIKLCNKISVTGVSLEHIPKSISPTGKIDTAPKDFSVWGLTYSDDPEPFFFGQFRYCSEGSHVQYFAVKQRSNRLFDIIEFRVLSNYGNPEYTCVYRLRVHGVLSCPTACPPKCSSYENSLKKCS